MAVGSAVFVGVGTTAVGVLVGVGLAVAVGVLVGVAVAVAVGVAVGTAVSVSIGASVTVGAGVCDADRSAAGLAAEADDGVVDGLTDAEPVDDASGDGELVAAGGVQGPDSARVGVLGVRNGIPMPATMLTSRTITAAISICLERSVVMVFRNYLATSKTKSHAAHQSDRRSSTFPR